MNPLKKFNFPISGCHGFTLVEMLVVLVLTSLIGMLLLEGLIYTLHLRSRFLEQLDDSQTGILQEYWFRSTIAGIITDYEDGEHIFQGQSRELSGLTLAALDMKAGIPTSFAWQLQYADGITTLRYQNSQGDYWEVAKWSGDSGGFQYMSRDGEWHKQWPPQLGEPALQIPQVILFQGQRRQMAINWLVKLSDLNYTRYDYRLYEN
jgi:general secretion pathway protein J